MNFLVDPTIVTKFDRTVPELELYFLFCQVVAGKNARTQAKALDAFMQLGIIGSPFERIKAMIDNNVLVDNLKAAKLGQYTRLEKGFTASLSLILQTATVAELKAIPGVGDKTARYFLLHSRANQNIAVLDRHVLRYLGSLGHKVPEGSANEKQYPAIEQIFLEEAKKANMTPADFDLMLWNQFSKKTA